MLNAEILRRKVIDGCESCGGTGEISNIQCDCVSIYRVLVAMLVGYFPEEYILKLYKKILTDNFEIEEGIEYFQKASSNYQEFIEEGLGIVFYGNKSDMVATMLVYLILTENYSINCRYFDGNRNLEGEDIVSDILVIDFGTSINLSQVENVLQVRQKRTYPTLVCIPGIRYLDDYQSLAEVLGYDDGKFIGEVFKGVKIAFSNSLSRWNNFGDNNEKLKRNPLFKKIDK